MAAVALEGSGMKHQGKAPEDILSDDGKTSTPEHPPTTAANTAGGRMDAAAVLLWGM